MNRVETSTPHVHKLSAHGPFPVCWERAEDWIERYAEAAEASEIIEATDAHELVTCAACRKGMCDA